MWGGVGSGLWGAFWATEAADLARVELRTLDTTSTSAKGQGRLGQVMPLARFSDARVEIPTPTTGGSLTSHQARGSHCVVEILPAITQGEPSAARRTSWVQRRAYSSS